MAGRGEEHSLQLDEDEELQLALAISAAEASGGTTNASEDERLARQLQEAEYAQAQAASQQQGASGASSSPPHLPSAAPPGSTMSTSGSGSGSGRLVDKVQRIGSDAMQRIGSGSTQLWQGFKRVVDPPQQQHQQQPYYPQQQQPVGGYPQHYPPHPPPQYYNQPQPNYMQPQQQPFAQPTGGPGWQQQHQRQQQPRLSQDEALALALQQQFDLEERQQLLQQQQQQQQPRPIATGPLGSNVAAATAAAAASRPSAGGAPPGAARPGLAQHQPPQQLPADPSRCAGCGASLYSLLGGRSAYITALGCNWHRGCLKCVACSQPIGMGRGGVQFSVREGRPYHPQCHRERFHPKCDVCGDFVPEQPNRRIVWSEVPFWRQRYCPHHEEEGGGSHAARCCACTRRRPLSEAWAELEDGRQLCLQCLDTITTDTRDAQPLWQNVLSFYAGVGMSLPAVPPMMLVDSGALNEAEGQETHGRGRGGGPVFHVRGLCLTEEYSTLRTVLRIPGGNPFSVRQETVQVGATCTEVTGILVLYGLPRLLTGSILAHECMHAWLRMSGFSASASHLPEQVEEGLCQLMALLWLEAQQAQGFKDAFEERLAAFFAHQIRSDQSVVYGDGFRLAHEAFQVHGLQALLAHVRRVGAFPPPLPQQ